MDPIQAKGKNNNRKIIFLATAEFAVPSLQQLYDNGYDIKAVVTTPDKKSGRGRKITPSPIKSKVLELNKNTDIPILQPEKLSDQSFIDQLKSYEADLQVVVAFRMLPEAVWNMPKYGTINLHASLLPKFRGAAPINWAIIKGEKKTGVTTFFLDKNMDTGNIAYQEEEDITTDDDYGSIYDRLKIKGSKLVLKTVDSIFEGKCPSLIQNNIVEEQLRKAPKIHKEDCQINWNQSDQEIINFVRGLSPIPGAWTYLNDNFFKIFRARLSQSPTTQQAKLSPGEVYIHNKETILVGTGTQPVEILELQAEGKKRMQTKIFLLGNEL